MEWFKIPCGLWLNSYTPKCYLMNDNTIISHGRSCFQQYGKLTMKIWSEYVDDWNFSQGYHDILTKKCNGIPKSVSSRFGSFSDFKRLCGVGWCKGCHRSNNCYKFERNPSVPDRLHSIYTNRSTTFLYYETSKELQVYKILRHKLYPIHFNRRSPC